MAYRSSYDSGSDGTESKSERSGCGDVCRERIRWKLIYFSMPEVSVNVTDDEAETSISATRGKMYPVTRQVKIPHPEKKIRLKKKLETIK